MSVRPRPLPALPGAGGLILRAAAARTIVPRMSLTPQPPGLAEAEVSQDDRTMALLAHVLQVVTWFIGPLVIFLLKRQSRFAAFHALQALLWQVLIMVVGMGGMIAFFVLMFTSMPMGGSPPLHPPAAPPPVFFLFPLFWAGWMLIWVLTLVLALVYGIKASKGEWAEYPVLGAVARRLLHF
jgi:uncharacterized membrane protein